MFSARFYRISFACLVVVLRASATTFEERVELLFRPWAPDQLALSPDGRRVAYPSYSGGELQAVIVDLEHPSQKLTLRIADPYVVPGADEKRPAQFRFLRWATANRLVLAPTAHQSKILDDTITIAPVYAVDADGQNPKTLIEGDDFDLPGDAPEGVAVGHISRMPQILGFAPGNREEMLLRVAGGPAAPELIALNVRTAQTRYYDGPTPGLADGRLDLDRTLQRELAAELERKFPQRRVTLVDWSDKQEHILARVTGGSDAGRLFVYDRGQNTVLEVMRVAPWLQPGTLHETRYVEFAVLPGVQLSGYMTWPRSSRLQPPPLIVSFPSGFPGRPQAEFDPEAQALAELGLAVLRLNHRYQRGVPPGDRDLARSLIDRISIDDAALMIKRLAVRFPDRPVDVKHIATLGRGFGGYLAVRALQLRPDLFRVGVAIDAPMDLRYWLHPAMGMGSWSIPRELFPSDDTPWSELSVRDHPETLRRPVFFLVEPRRNEAIDLSVAAVRSALAKAKRPVDYVELDAAFGLGLPKSRAATYRRIEQFFNLQLYDYRVKIGPATEVK